MKNLFTIYGKMGRKQFWTIQICLILSYFAIGALASNLMLLIGDSSVVMLLAIGLGVLISLVAVATSVQRVRDITGNGHHWWLVFFVSLVPYIGVFVQLGFLMLPTDFYNKNV